MPCLFTKINPVALENLQEGRASDLEISDKKIPVAFFRCASNCCSGFKLTPDGGFMCFMNCTPLSLDFYQFSAPLSSRPIVNAFDLITRVSLNFGSPFLGVDLVEAFVFQLINKRQAGDKGVNLVMMETEGRVGMRITIGRWPEGGKHRSIYQFFVCYLLGSGLRKPACCPRWKKNTLELKLCVGAVVIMYGCGCGEGMETDVWV